MIDFENIRREYEEGAARDPKAVIAQLDQTVSFLAALRKEAAAYAESAAAGPTREQLLFAAVSEFIGEFDERHYAILRGISRDKKWTGKGKALNQLFWYACVGTPGMALKDFKLSARGKMALKILEVRYGKRVAS